MNIQENWHRIQLKSSRKLERKIVLRSSKVLGPFQYVQIALLTFLCVIFLYATVCSDYFIVSWFIFLYANVCSHCLIVSVKHLPIKMVRCKFLTSFLLLLFLFLCFTNYQDLFFLNPPRCSWWPLGKDISIAYFSALWNVFIYFR